MNTYKIKALTNGGRTPIKLSFTVDGATFRYAEVAARKRLKDEGHRYASITEITDLGPSKVPSPAQFEEEAQAARRIAIDKASHCAECGLLAPYHAANCGSMSMDAPRSKAMCKNMDCFNISDLGVGTYCWECSL